MTEEQIQHAKALIEAALQGTLHRDLIPAGEVQDTLLEIYSSMIVDEELATAIA